MNQKYLISLLVFFFLIHVEKIYGCHPSGDGCGNTLTNSCGARVLEANLLPFSRINLTVAGPKIFETGKNELVDGLGHFTMAIDGVGGEPVRFIFDPVFYNGHGCHGDDGPRAEPFTYSWSSDFKTPPKGTNFEVWISIYWWCAPSGLGKGRSCASEDVYYRGVVH